MGSKLFLLASICLFILVPEFANADDHPKLTERSLAAANDLQELMGAGDKSAPLSLMRASTCIVVVPNMKKVGFGVGGLYGRGLATCKRSDGWSAPEYVFLSGGSLGFQIGLAEVDLVLVFVNSNAVNRLSGGNFTIGGDVTVAVGPIGRDLQAGTDYQLSSEIFAYARSRGLFAGVSITGSALEPDQSADDTVYGPGHSPGEILSSTSSRVPRDVQSFVDSLNANIPK